MADTRKLKPRKGTTAQNNAYTGANGEITVDTSKKTLVVHDGTTAGGNPLPIATDITAAVAGHVAALDPHPQYLTSDEADALYEPIGEAAAAVATHVADADPHTQYQRAGSQTTADTGTITVNEGVSVLNLTAGAPVAAQSIDCTNLQDGGELLIYSTNGITLLTITGGTVIGTLASLGAGAFGRVARAGTNLLVGA